MSARKIDVRNVPRDEYHGRWKNARDRLAAMERELGEGLIDPALVLGVQAATAAADAICIFQLGERSAAKQHFDAFEVFTRITGIKGAEDARKHLARILEKKALIEYSGEPARKSDAEALAEHVRRFMDFVRRHLPDQK
jgi:HEPN domain-containing protein